MDNKIKQMRDMLNLQKTIAKVKEDKKEVEVAPVEVVEPEVVNTLPTTYISANQLKLSAKEMSHTVSYLDRLRQGDERYEKLQIAEEKAKKIRRGLTRLTTGTAAVVPLKCNGPECSFKTTCLTGDTQILLRGGEYKNLSKMEVGDTIYSFNIGKQKIESDVVTAFKHMGQKMVYRISTAFGNVIEATDDHPFLCEANTGDLVWNTISNSLSEGFHIVVEDFDPQYSDVVYSIGDCYGDVITSIEQVGLKDVYDITVKKNHNFIANSFVVHNCQPEDEVVLTTKGYKTIQDLDPVVDRIITYTNNNKFVARGRKFTKHERVFKGHMFTIKTDTKEYNCTSDHICSVMWNDEAINKHIVYLMQKGDKFRVGVTTLIQSLKNGKRKQAGLNVRARMEKADKAWVLSIHDNRVDALLDEEYFSIKAKAPKSLFIADEASRHTTWNGKSKWSTQDQLDQQFKRINGSVDFYRCFLKELGKDYDYPFYTKGSTIPNKFNTQLAVRACNLIPNVMSVIEIGEVPTDYEGEFNNLIEKTIKPISVTYAESQCKVYSLDVEKEHNYFTGNGLLTKNCPYYLEGVAPKGLACLVELQLIEYWMEKYQNEFNIEETSITDMHMIARLCEYDIYDMRLTRYIAEHDQTLLVDFISSYSEDGDPISNKAASAAFDVKDRINRLRSQTLKELMATREAKAKIMTTVVNNASTLNIANLKQKYDDLVKERTHIKVVNT